MNNACDRKCSEALLNQRLAGQEFRAWPNAYIAAEQGGRLKEAEALYEKALAVSRKPDGSYYPSAYDTFRGCANLLRKTHREARAAEMEAELKKLE